MMLALFSCLAWIVLLVLWGGFWRADQRLGAVSRPTDWPDVTILIPARNEAQTIGEVVSSHVASTYRGHITLIVIDDDSDDSTEALATQAGAQVVKAEPLPEGWSGKLWALQNGLNHADEIAPNGGYLLLTDADIQHDPATLAALVAKAEAEQLDLVSVMARLDARDLWGALLIPAFIFFFQKLYPFPWVNRANLPIAAAAGGCVLLRRDSLRRIGDFTAIRDALIDDCALASHIKRKGGKIWLGLADQEAVSLRDNRSFRSIWTMVRRTAFTQLRHSWLLLILAVIGMSFLYLGPLVGLIHGLVTLTVGSIFFGSLACGMMAIAYWPTLRLYNQPLWWTLTLPIAAILYTGMTVASALSHLNGKGGAWKGRTYP